MGVGLVDSSNRRVVETGGGADVRDYLSDKLSAENCTELCYYGMMFGGLFYNWYNLPDYTGNNVPHYLKCIEASAAAPLNGLRLQHASQFSTLNLDPAVPMMNITDWKACLRMLLEFLD